MSTNQKNVYVAFNEFTPPISGKIMIENETEALVRCEHSYTDGVCGDHPDEYETWEVRLPLGTHWVKKTQIFKTESEANQQYAFYGAKEKFKNYAKALREKALEIEKRHNNLMNDKILQIKMWEDLDSIMEKKYEYKSKLWEEIAELEEKKAKLEAEVLTLENFKQILSK